MNRQKGSLRTGRFPDDYGSVSSNIWNVVERHSEERCVSTSVQKESMYMNIHKSRCMNRQTDRTTDRQRWQCSGNERVEGVQTGAGHIAEGPALEGRR